MGCDFPPSRWRPGKSIYLYVHLLVCLFVKHTTCLSVYLLLLSICKPICTSIKHSTYLFVCLSVCLCVDLSVDVSVSQSVNQSVYQSVSQYISQLVSQSISPTYSSSSIWRNLSLFLRFNFFLFFFNVFFVNPLIW